MEEVNCLQDRELVKSGLLDGRGFVRVIKVSPETHPKGYTPEYLIAKAARLSYGSDNKSAKADKSLIEYVFHHILSETTYCNVSSASSSQNRKIQRVFSKIHRSP